MLIAGAGGGFDVYAGLPLALALQKAGAGVHPANLSFTDLGRIDLEAWLEPAPGGPARDRRDRAGGRRHDILMRGDETGLGTPEADMASLAAVATLEVPAKLVTCLGFGIDAYHGVNHVQVLENLAALDREGAYLGALSIPSHSREAALYREAVADAQAARNLYLNRLQATEDMQQLATEIYNFRQEITPRLPRTYPH